MDLGVLQKKIAKLEQQVCRIEFDTARGRKTGTGFLVGPNLVLTNYHVVEELAIDSSHVDNVKLRFDFKTTDEQGTSRTINKGNEYLGWTR
ncbi:MAG: trypsin-like serine protease [Saprospiraceae bacterium]|nr:trypsin-like serine protease [Saprospiraceae bacterium]